VSFWPCTVQAVDTDDDLDAAELILHAADRVLDAALPQSSVKLRGLNADGECLDGDGPVVVRHGESIQALVSVHPSASPYTNCIDKVSRTYKMSEQVLEKWPRSSSV
jgi:hypothetical protein